MEAILLVSHGSRESSTAMTVERVARELENTLGRTVVPAFMEFNEPGVGKALELLYQQGYKKVTVLPYFLFSGIHIKKDVPKIINSFVRDKGDVKVNMVSPIGYHPLLIEILKDRLNEGREKINDVH
ncbi:sirohydrochlorin chelatase [Thermovenabulum sp.]|uniref:sirohydrochlorin chelatase n=1 Tax=Thermovenabulum sp. TaxID=3100335 RepID=UPI003C7B1B52